MASLKNDMDRAIDVMVAGQYSDTANQPIRNVVIDAYDALGVELYAYAPPGRENGRVWLVSEDGDEPEQILNNWIPLFRHRSTER